MDPMTEDNPFIEEHSDQLLKYKARAFKPSGNFNSSSISGEEINQIEEDNPVIEEYRILVRENNARIIKNREILSRREKSVAKLQEYFDFDTDLQNPIKVSDAEMTISLFGDELNFLRNMCIKKKTSKF